MVIRRNGPEPTEWESGAMEQLHGERPEACGIAL